MKQEAITQKYRINQLDTENRALREQKRYLEFELQRMETRNAMLWRLVKDLRDSLEAQEASVLGRAS